MDDVRRAVDALVELGLTQYEAKCFVALARVPSGTATDVSELAEVPRSRVYETLERLHDLGLVDVQQSDPRRYRAIEIGRALDTLRRSYRSRIEAADDALRTIGSHSEPEAEGTWAIAEREHVVDRTCTLIGDATEELYLLVTDAELLEDEVLARLADADERGVRIVADVPSESARDRVLSTVPEAHVAVSGLATEPTVRGGRWLGRILLADRNSALVSARREDGLAGVEAETAVWSRGLDHGLVVGLGELIGSRIDDVAD